MKKHIDELEPDYFYHIYNRVTRNAIETFGIKTKVLKIDKLES